MQTAPADGARSDDVHGPVPDPVSFARELTEGGSRPRAVKQLYTCLCQIDGGGDPAKRIAALEKLGRWVCAGPKPPPADRAPDGEARPTVRLRLLVRALEISPPLRGRLVACLTAALEDASALRLLCEVGIPNQRGLWDETADRLARRLLPTPPDHADLAELVARMFRAERDAVWLADIPTRLVQELLAQLGDPWQPLRDCMEDAIALLTTRASALGLSEDIRRRGPAGPVRQSPFFLLPYAPVSELPGLMDACRRDMLTVHENLERSGVSVDVVYRLDVIGKCLDRLEALLAAFVPGDTSEAVSAETKLVATLVRGRIRESSVRDVVSSNMRLLARKVIERAGDTGEHYITVSRKEWFKMLASAGGGGFLTVFTCSLKFLTKWGLFPPFVDGALASLNYSASFVLMQFLGFTLATKQPSMTAAALAGSIREQRDAHQLDDLVTTIARICRSQLAAALGNIGIVIPSALGFDFLFNMVYGHSFLDPTTAQHTIESLHPLHTGTVFFAAFTGVLLWASSLGAGWLENWAVYRRLPEAIAEHRAGKYLGRGLFRRLSRFFAHQVAGVGGSVTLGVLLGMMPVLGKFFGVPIDVRHVTLSTGSLVLSIRALGPAVISEPDTLWAMGGIGIIGLMNFGVSFLFALGVAFRAREVPTRQVIRLGLAVLGRFVRSPFEFLFPPSRDNSASLPAHRHTSIPPPNGRKPTPAAGTPGA